MTAPAVELKALLPRFIGIVGQANWHTKLYKIKSQIRANPLWKEYLVTQHGLELALADIHQYFQKTGRYPWPPRNDLESKSYSFIPIVCKVHQRLNQEGKIKLEQVLRKHLTGDFGLAPLAFEMAVAGHLMARGFDVHLSDIEKSGGYDFLASRDGSQIEVECKFVAPSLGRSVSRRAVFNLWGLLAKRINTTKDDKKTGIFIDIAVPGHLPSDIKKLDEIAKTIIAIANGDIEQISEDHGLFTPSIFRIEKSPFDANLQKISGNDIRYFVNERFNIEEEEIFCVKKPGTKALIVAVRSDKPVHFHSSLLKKLKNDTKNQFSQTAPALMCVGFAEVSANEMRNLAENDENGKFTGIRLTINNLLNSRPVLHSVALFSIADSLGFRKEYPDGLLQTGIATRGTAYLFHNQQHPSYDDANLMDIFGDS